MTTDGHGGYTVCNLSQFPNDQSLKDLDLPDLGPGKNAQSAQRRVRTFLLAAFAALAPVAAGAPAALASDNDDSASPAAVTIADASADEGDAITFTVKLDKAVPGGLTVRPRYRDDTATSGTDYTRNTGDISFSGTAGETHSFSVSTSEDEDIEDNETFTVGLIVWGTSHRVTARSTATGTINNDDSASPAAVTIADASADEGDAIAFTVTLDKAVPGGLTVTPSFTDGTATQGTDYTENTTALTFTGAANETQTFSVSTTEDTDVEGNETFTVGLAVSDTSYSVTATATATGTITNDDSAAVTIADASADEGDAITFTVKLDKAVTGGLTVTPSFTDGTATQGTDYTENTTALTFTGAANETRTFSVSTTEDTEVEANETFTVGLTVSGTTHSVTATDTATATITNDDTAPPAALTIADASADEGDAITFTVTLDNAVSGGLTVTPSFTDGTATKGTDYTENTTALAFTGTANETQTFSVSTTEDTDVEGNETFTVGLTVSGTTHSVTATDTATGTITNDDTAPSAALTIADASADEGDAITFTVTLDKAVTGGLTVTPSFTDGTATQGTDYTENTTALTFTGAANETRTFSVSTTEDTEVEANETFTVGLTVSGTTHSVTATDTATGTITNDDTAPPAALTIADASADEGDAITFTVTLDKAVDGGLTVTPSFTDVTATKGTDYTENTTALTFTGAANETRTFSVSTTEDTEVEANETFTVGLAVSGTTHSVTATDTATGTITNDDTAPPAALTIADASADEGDAITFTVTLDKAVDGGLTVTPSFTDVTAAKGTDYTENTTALTFTGAANETRTFSVSTTEDTEVEANETFTVGLAVSGTTHSVTATDTATGTIANDDTAPPAALTIADASADEGDAITFSVTLDNAVPGGFTVTPSFTDVTAAKGTDYTENTTALTFTGAANETRTFSVSTTEDTEVEANETFTVGLAVSGTTHSVTATDTATGTITNDDQARTVSATLTIADGSADEGDALSFTVTLDNAVPGGFTVTPTFTDGVPARGSDYSHLTATKGRDYRANTLTLDFAGTAGETVIFTVPTIEDYKAEYPKLFTVGLSVSGTSHRVTATDTATGIIYDDDAASASASGGAAASSSQIKDNGSSITIYSPPDPEFDRMEYECTIPKRVTETTDASLRFKHLQIACGARPGSVRTGASAEFWSSGSATATKGSSGDWDYEFFHEKLKFYPAERSTKRLGFRVNDDELGEGPEYFQFALKWSTKVGIGWLGIWVTINESVHIVTIWIDDDDVYNLSIAPASVTEAGGAKTVTVTAAVADGAKLAEARKLSIQVGKSGDLAVEGTDYQTVDNFDITIPKGSNKGAGTFTITPVVDAHLEPNERITVAGSGKSDINGKVLRPRVNSAALWLNDSSVVTLSASPSVNEGGGAQTVTVTATSTGTAQRATPVTVSVGKSGDAAVEGTDYQAVSDFTLTIPSGSKTGTATFQITPINDTAVEDDETITLSGSFPGGTVTDGSLTLLDNDVTLALSPASTGEEAGAKTVTVTARAKTARTAARALTVSVGKVGDSAEAGTDYGAVSDFTLTIPANQASGTATFTFTPRDDKIIEGIEKVTVHGTGTGLDVGQATLSITETDTTDFVITLGPDEVAEGVNWRNLKVQVTTTDGYTISQKVTCRFRNGGGSATWGGDYQIHKDNKWISPPGSPGTSINPTITINPGTTYGYTNVRLKTIGDNTVEGDETVQIKGYTRYPHIYKSCTSSDNPRTVDSEPYPANLTIVDDETSISLSTSPSSVAEDAGDTSVTVTAKMGGNRNAPAEMPVTVTVGKSGDAAVSGTDYEAVDAFKITIPQGKKSATKTITFTPKDDTLAEDDETVTLTGKTPKTSVGSTQLTIDDDDDTGITLTASPASVSEGGGAKTVTVTASTDGTTFPAPRHVNVQVGKTGDGATEGTDYKTVADFTVTIPYGKTKGAGTFTLTPVDDSTLESDESISISGTTSKSDTVKGTSVTLADDDASITLAAAPSSVTEDGGAKTVTVTATAASAVEADTAVTIAVGNDGDSATEGTDYSTVADFTLTIKSGKTKGTGTFTLTPTDDDLYEGGSESLTVSGSATGVRVGTASVEITDAADNEEVEVSLSLKPTRAKECTADTEVWVTAKLPDSADAVVEDRKITVSVGKSGDGAVSGTDYTAVTDFDLTIPAGHRSALASFDLKPVNDDDVEGDEKLTVHGTAKRLKVKNEPQMTLVDDDQPIVILTMNPATIPENDTETTVTVTASLFTGDFCGKTHDVAAVAPARSAASMVGASAAEVARAVLGPGARAVSANSTRTVNVSVGDTGDTATSGTDYTAVSKFTISIPAGKSSGTATFTTTASLDNLLEPSETLTVKGTSTGTTVTPAGGHVADKDKATPTLTVSPSSLSESAGATSMTVTVTTGGVKSSQRFEVPVRVSGGTATAGTDFAKLKDFDLVLAANATSATGTFTLTPTDDTLVEGDETLNVIIPNTELSAAVTLTDDDDGTITLSASPSSVPESGGDESVTVTAATGGATFPADRTVTVTVGDSGDSATSGTDYAAVSSFDITIKAGKTSGSDSFTLTPRQDTIIEGDESITVGGTSTGVTVNSATVTLTDDDSTDITLRVSPSSVSEGAEATEVTVTAVTDGDTFSADRTVTVSVGKNTDSATSGTDYAAVADLDVTLSAGETSGSGTFTLTPKQDTLVEGEEAVTVSGAATGLTVNATSATITDDDTAPEINLSTNPSSVSEGASGTTVTVTATFSSASTYASAKTVSVTVGESTDSATSGTDYAAVTGFDITISAGNSSGIATFTLTPKDDTLVEGDETISVDGTSTGLSVNATTLTLADDDDAPALNLSVNPSSVGEGDSATQVTVTANFSNTNTYTTNKTVTVTVGKNTDSATSGTDYAAVADIDITIYAGKTSGSGTFTLTPKDDTLVEGNETISVDGASTGLTVNGASVTLTDDDGPPVVNLSVNPSSVSEGAAATSVTVTATFSNTSTYAAAKTVSITVGDSADSADSGTDYAAVTAFDVTIAAGDSSGNTTFTLTPTDDTVVEGNETLSLSGTSDLTVNGASMTLTDNDGPPAINLSANPSSVSEGAAATSVTVTASFSNSNTYPAAKTVSVTVGDSADSAISGTDYAAVSAFDVTIAAGKSSGTATFTLTPTDDTVIEGNETISLSGTSDLTVNGASMTLTDDDSTEITLSTNPSSVAEEDSATAVTVTAETDGDTFTNDRTVRVKVGSASDSATSGKDYAAVTAFDITITAGETSATGTFTLTPTEDNIIEGEEAISVSGTSTGLTVNAASVTIDDNDEPKIILDIKPFLNTDPDKLPESAGATRVTVTAGTTGGVFELDRQIHVTVGKSGDTAVFGTDYDTPSKAFHVLITASKTKGEKTFTLTPTDDVIVEGDESLTLEGSAAGLEVTTATITIKDNDDANMTLAANPASVSEGAGATSVTVTASTGGVTFPADRTVTVTVGESGDSATSGTDYAAVADFDVVISTGQNSGTGTFTLTPTDDTLVEGDETIGVSATSLSKKVTGTTLTLTDDDSAEVTVNDASAAEGSSMTFTVTLDTAVVGGLTVTPGFTNGTASSTDYTENTTALNFNGTANETRTFDVSTTADTMLEADETFTVDLTLSGTSLSVAATDTGTGTIEDNDGATLTIDDASADEGGDLTFTVTLNQEVQGSVTVTPSYTHVTTDGEDYTANTTPLTFSGPVQARTFTVSTVQDENVEEDETFTVGLTLSETSLGITATDTGTGTINNDDFVTGSTKGVELSVSPSSVSEGAGATKVTVTATLPEGVTLPDATGIAIQVTGGTATVGDDFAAVGDFQVTIPADAQAGTGTFTLTPVLDTEEEADETVLIDGSSEALTVGSTQLLITDEIHEVELSASPSSVSEDAGETNVKVTATLPEGVAFPAATGIAIRVTGGTATAGDDFEAVDDFRITIPAGERAGTGTFILTPIVDTEDESDETVLIQGSSESLTVGSTQVLITDPDDENDDPAFAGDRIREVPENTPSGEPIGAPVWARDPDRDNLEYRLAGTDAESFTIDKDSGQLRTLAPLDYEAVSSYDVTVEVTDGKDTHGGDDPEVDDTVEVTINVIDVDEPPDAPDAPAVQRVKTSILGVTWKAPENGGRPPIIDYDLEYRAAGSDDPYRDAGYDGTATRAQIPGVEEDLIYEVRVRASNDEGTSPWSAPGREAERERNHPPVAVDDLIHVRRGGETGLLVGNQVSAVRTNQESLSTAAPDRTNNVLANDSDPEDDVSQLRAELVTAPAHGELRLDPKGTFSYRHDGGRSREDVFTYRAQDTDGAYSNVATVRIVVPNSGPVGSEIPDQRLRLGRDGAVDLAEYFDDPDGDPLTYQVKSWDQEIVTVGLTDSRVRLSPVRVAVTRVTATATDPEGLSAEQTFGVEVETVADPDRILELSLATLGRTVASQAVDTIGERFRNRTQTRGMQATIGGQRLEIGAGSDSNRSAAVQRAAAGLAGAAGRSGPGGQDPVMDLLRNPAGGPGRPVAEPISMPGMGGGFSTGLATTGGMAGTGAMAATGGMHMLSDRERMRGSSFDMSLDADGDGEQEWALWGRGVGSFFSGLTLGDSRLDGRVGAAYVGADHQWGDKVVLGAAVSHSRGTLDYEDIGGVEGRLEAGLTTVHPYVHWSPREGLGLWGMMGVGRGSADLELGTEAKQMGIDLRMAAFGGRNELARLGGVDLALKGDAFAVSIGSEGVPGLRTVRGGAQRTRLMLEGSRSLELSPGNQLTPILEVGVRLDGGDAETGAGAELAGGVSYLNGRSGLSVEARGHWLVAHQAQDFRERGFGVTVRLDPGADGTGWSLQVSPQWGTAGGGAETLWGNDGMMAGGPAGGMGEEMGWSPGYAQADLAYGMAAWRGRGLLTPFARVDSQGSGMLLMGGGLRFELPGKGGGGSQRMSGPMSRGLRLELSGVHSRSRSSSDPGQLPQQQQGPGGDFGVAVSLSLNN